MSTPPPTPLTLGGRSTGSGTLTTRQVTATLVTLPGQSTGSGTITASASTVPGAFADFAMVPYVAASPYADPMQTNVTTFLPRKDSDAVNAWQRISITATAPSVAGAYGTLGGSNGALYPTPAAYARIGFISDAVPTNTNQQVAFGQFERTPGGQSVTYPESSGNNILGLDQSSFEGQVVYLADRVGASVMRSSEMSVTGNYSGKYQYALPPNVNSYSRVTYFQEYELLQQLRVSYADVLNRAYTKGEVPAPSEPSGSSTTVGGPTSFTWVPTGSALGLVAAGVTYQCSLWVTADIVGLVGQCSLIVYDANYSVLSTITVATSGASGSTATIATARKWVKARLTTPPLPAGATWAALVPLVTSGSTPYDELAFWADELRVWSTTNISQAGPGVSPARAWQPPRQFTVQLKANRINLCENPRLRNGTTLTGTGAVNRMSAYSPPSHSTFTLNAVSSGGFDGGVAGQVVIPEGAVSTFTAAGSQGYMGATSTAGTTAFIQGIQPNSVFTVSVYTQQAAGSLPSTIWAYDGARWVRGTTTSHRQSGASSPANRLSVTVRTGLDWPGSTVIRIGYAAADVAETYNAVPPSLGSIYWTPTTLTASGPWDPTVHYTGSVTPGASAVVSYHGQNWQAVYSNGLRTNTAAHTLNISGILAETGTTAVGTYFDGSTNSLDYMWETNTQPYQSRSHYYRGKMLNAYRLDAAIRDALPVGATYQLIYAPRP